MSSLVIRSPYPSAVAGAPNPDFSNVVLLCHFDGTDGSTTFTDEKGHTLSGSANFQLDTAEKKWGTASGLSDGTGDSITTPDSADWAFGSGDFNVELWVKFNVNTGTQCFVAHYNSTGNQRAWYFRLTTGNLLTFAYSVDGVNMTTVEGAWAPTTTQWHHVTAEREGTTLRVMADGVVIATGTIGTSTIFDSTQALRISGINAGTVQQFVNGWIDDLRITKGESFYRGAYVVPTGAFPNS